MKKKSLLNFKTHREALDYIEVSRQQKIKNDLEQLKDSFQVLKNDFKELKNDFKELEIDLHNQSKLYSIKLMISNFFYILIVIILTISIINI